MARRFTVIVSALVVASSLVFASPSSAATVPVLPSGYENFTPDIDYSAFLGNAVTGNLDMTCTVDNSNVAAFPQGSSFNPANIESDPLGTGIKFLGAMGGSSNEVAATCPVAVAIPNGVRTAKGSVTNEALGGMGLPTSGDFTLDCDVASTFAATAKVRFGSGVPGKFDVVVSAADKPIPFNCSLSVSFGSSVLNGSVKGEVRVVDPASVGMCDGSTTISCVPIRLTDAAVAITSSTGKFGGLTGTGTYSFTDAFSLKFIDDKMTSNQFVSITKSSVRRASVRAQSGASESMTIQLSARKKSATAILRPVGATIAANDGVYVTGAARASCSLSAKVGAKTTRIATFTLKSTGQAAPKVFTSRIARAVGAKSGKSVTLTASCKGTDGKTTTSVKRVTFSG